MTTISEILPTLSDMTENPLIAAIAALPIGIILWWLAVRVTESKETVQARLSVYVALINFQDAARKFYKDRTIVAIVNDWNRNKSQEERRRAEEKMADAIVASETENMDIIFHFLKTGSIGNAFTKVEQDRHSRINDLENKAKAAALELANKPTVVNTKFHAAAREFFQFHRSHLADFSMGLDSKRTPGEGQRPFDGLLAYSREEKKIKKKLDRFIPLRHRL